MVAKYVFNWTSRTSVSGQQDVFDCPLAARLQDRDYLGVAESIIFAPSPTVVEVGLEVAVIRQSVSKHSISEISNIPVKMVC